MMTVVYRSSSPCYKIRNGVSGKRKTGSKVNTFSALQDGVREPFVRKIYLSDTYR